MKQIDLFDIPDGAWTAPHEVRAEDRSAPEAGESEFGESPLNRCVVRAAELRHDFGQYQMEHTIPSLFPAGSCPRWVVQSPGAKKNAIRMAYLSIYAYLALRAKSRPELQAEVSELTRLFGNGFDEFLSDFAPEILL